MSAAGSEHIDELLQWAKENGSSLNPSVEVYNDRITGFSFRAKDTISKGTQLGECAYETTISWLNAIEASDRFPSHSQSFPADFLDFLSQNDPNVIGYFFLIQQYLLKKKSFWWPYIRLLPQPNELTIPTLWTEEDQKFLNGTNAEPAVHKRKELWLFEWSQAQQILEKAAGDWKLYSFELYQWAAAIFGSRSFRPSLTTSPNLFVENVEAISSAKSRIQDHIKDDTFSILLPVLDIGNHNGVDKVEWLKGSASFSFSSLQVIPKDGQIYNYYGDKSNSELLVAYGFILDNVKYDRVNIKLSHLPTDVQDFRRSRSNHITPPKSRSDEEFLYHVQNSAGDHLSKGLAYISDGLFDTIIYLVANTRERNIMLERREYIPEQDSAVFLGNLARAAYGTLQVLGDKIQSELSRIKLSSPGGPKSPTQHLATSYRRRTEYLLEQALATLQSQPRPQLLTLTSAYAWLKLHHYEIYTIVEELVATDQEETLPLDWGVLIEDWDHTYLVVWLYIILSIHECNPQEFATRHPQFANSWLQHVLHDVEDDTLYAENGELETLELTSETVAAHFGHSKEQSARLRNIATYILKRESMKGLLRTGNTEDDAQEMLCIPDMS